MLRGGAFALKGEAATIARGARARGDVRAVVGARAVLPGRGGGAIAAGEVPVGNAAGDEWASWTGSTSIFVGVLAVVTGAHLAAVFLGADSRRAGRARARATRSARRALGSGVVAGRAGDRRPGWSCTRTPPDLFDGLTSGAGLACVLALGGRGAGHALARVARALRGRALHRGRGRRRDRRGLGGRPGAVPAAARPDGRAGGRARRDAARAAWSPPRSAWLLLVPALAWLFRLALSGRLAYEEEPRP